MHDGHRERMKARLLEGSSFADHELLELLLYYAIPRRDTNPIAHALIERFGSLRGVLEAPSAELMQTPGIGEHAAALLELLPVVAKRYYMDSAAHIRLRTPREAVQYTINMLFGKTNEMVWLLCLDMQHNLAGKELISQGTLDRSAMYIRNVAAAAMRYNAARVILAHNHPTGSPRPSAEDVSATLEVIRALAPLEVAVSDHIIVSGQSYYSFFEERICPELYGPDSMDASLRQYT